MKHGIWTPLPHTIKREPAMAAAIDDAVRQQPVEGPDKAFAFAAEVLQEAERLGFRSSLVAERFMGPDLEAWVLASALATQTRTLELIVAVHPGMFTAQACAKMIATLDRISGGRAAVNIVNGWHEVEFRNYGNGAWLAASDARYARMRDFMAVLRGMTEQAEFSYEGAFYSVDRISLPSRPVQPGIPIYAASSGEAGKEMIAELGDCWMLLPVFPQGYLEFETVFASIAADVADMKVRAARHGRNVQVGMTSHVIACPTDAEALEKARELEAYGAESPINQVVALAIGSGLVGSYDTVARRLSRYRDAGIGVTMFHFHPMMEGMRTFMHEVVPRMSPAAHV